MKKKLVAVIACRNNSSRLYAKPLQFLDYNAKITILTCIIDGLKKNPHIDDVVLAVSDSKDNYIYKVIAKKNKIKFFFGSDRDVLLRLVCGAKMTSATDVFRITSESPFVSLDKINKYWKKHIKENNDLTIYSNNVDGMGFEIFTTNALIKSHKLGKKKHRSELCDLYIRENIKKFKVSYNIEKLTNKKFRLTVDNPEDLILCKKIFQSMKADYPEFKIKKIINFLNHKDNKMYIRLANQFINKSKTIDNLWKNA